MIMIKVTGYHGEPVLIPVDKIAFVSKFVPASLSDPEVKAGIKSMLYITTSPSLQLKVKDSVEEIAAMIEKATTPLLPIRNQSPISFVRTPELGSD